MGTFLAAVIGSSYQSNDYVFELMYRSKCNLDKFQCQLIDWMGINTIVLVDIFLFQFQWIWMWK